MTLYIYRPINRATTRHAPQCGDFAKLQIKTGVATACGIGRDCVHPVCSCHGRACSACGSHDDAISTLAVAA